MIKNTHEDFRESRLRENVDFPFELYEMKTEGSLIYVDCYWQEEVEILLRLFWLSRKIWHRQSFSGCFWRSGLICSPYI